MSLAVAPGRHDHPQLRGIVQKVDSKLKQLCVPSSIKATLSTQWDDVTTNANHYTLHNTPTDTTIANLAALLFDPASSQFGDTTNTWNTIVGNTALDLFMVCTLEAAGGGQASIVTPAGTFYLNPGWLGDPTQYINAFPCGTAGGPIDYAQSGIYDNSGTTSGDMRDVITRSVPLLLHAYGTAGTNNFHLRVNGGTVQTATIGTTIRASSGKIQIAASGAPSPYLKCKISLVGLCGGATVMTARETADVGAMIAEAYNQPSWVL